MDVPLYRHNLINEDTQSLGEQFGKMLSDMIISTGPVNKQVSDMFAAYMDRQHCLLTSSWSGGMLATLIALNIKPGDEVIVPAMTFTASANVIEVLGAKPVFVDIDPHTKLMDLSKVANSITDKTKAIMPVHLYGQMVDVKKLKEIASNIAIVEDAAHAIESAYNSDRPGTHSKAAVFSFYQSKNMTTGEGGAIVTDDEQLYNKIKLTYRHGVDLCGYQRHIREEFIAPDVITAGIKANMPDILAIMLPPQIKRAENNLARRREIAKRYMHELDGLGIEFPHVDPVAKHAWHIFAVGVDPAKREKALVYLYNHGVKTTVHFKAMHVTSYYNKKYGHYPLAFPNAYHWGESVFSLPVFPGLTEEEQTHVIKQVKLSLA